jgi:hypothetical protein
MPELPGHERRAERRAERHGRRYVRSGDEFTSYELEHDEVELEERRASREPDHEEYEPWNLDESKATDFDRERFRLYREFVESRRDDPDYVDNP